MTQVLDADHSCVFEDQAVSWTMEVTAAYVQTLHQHRHRLFFPVYRVDCYGQPQVSPTLDHGGLGGNLEEDWIQSRVNSHVENTRILDVGPGGREGSLVASQVQTYLYTSGIFHYIRSLQDEEGLGLPLSTILGSLSTKEEEIVLVPHVSKWLQSGMRRLQGGSYLLARRCLNETRYVLYIVGECQEVIAHE